MLAPLCRTCRERHYGGCDYGRATRTGGQLIEGSAILAEASAREALNIAHSPKPLAIPKPERKEIARQAIQSTTGKRTRGNQMGAPVTVRLQSEMMAWIDAHRARHGQTRPEAIRDILGAARIVAKRGG